VRTHLLVKSRLDMYPLNVPPRRKQWGICNNDIYLSQANILEGSAKSVERSQSDEQILIQQAINANHQSFFAIKKKSDIFSSS